MSTSLQRLLRSGSVFLAMFVLPSYPNAVVAQSMKHLPAHQIDVYSNVRDLIIIAFPIQGWYLLSLPVTPNDNTVATLFPMAIGGVTYAWENNQYVSKTTVETGKGYWVAIPGPSAAFITDTPVTSFSGHYGHRAGSSSAACWARRI
jgi:hypothetical protein